MQNYNDIPQLAGLEEDLALKQEMEAKIVCCKALKCYYIALTYLNGQKWPEARALFQRATIYANKAKNDTIVPDSMREGKLFRIHLIFNPSYFVTTLELCRPWNYKKEKENYFINRNEDIEETLLRFPLFLGNL